MREHDVQYSNSKCYELLT